MGHPRELALAGSLRSLDRARGVSAFSSVVWWPACLGRLDRASLRSRAPSGVAMGGGRYPWRMSVGKGGSEWVRADDEAPSRRFAIGAALMIGAVAVLPAAAVFIGWLLRL